MPSTSIDTFFACSLLVSVAIIATAFLAGTMQTRIDNFQNPNNNLLQNIADHIVTSCGIPQEWGRNANITPSSFGLAKNGSLTPYELDVDKVSRLNSQNNNSLSYMALSQAARLDDIAFKISFSQMLSITITPASNNTIQGTTTYTFLIQVSQSSGPVQATLHCYTVTGGSFSQISNETSENGIGYITAQISSSSNEPAFLIVFARASFDERMTSYAVYSFDKNLQTELPENSYLTPLNYSLNLDTNLTNVVITKGYAFTFSYQLNLTTTSGASIGIPEIVDKSPIILTVSGSNGSKAFVEWVSYPQIPLEVGSNFQNSQKNVITYIVSVRGSLYKLTMSFGDIVK